MTTYDRLRIAREKFERATPCELKNTLKFAPFTLSEKSRPRNFSKSDGGMPFFTPPHLPLSGRRRTFSKSGGGMPFFTPPHLPLSGRRHTFRFRVALTLP